jgi:L-lactate dehydrogenase
MAKRKIVIVGSGNVGMSFAFALMMDGVAEEIVIVSRSQDKAVGETMDLGHGAALLGSVAIRTGGYSECANADVIVITTGVKQQPNESRLSLAARNIELFTTVIRDILKYNSSPLLVIVTNPVDVLAYVAVKNLGLSPERVIGTGTVLDSARLRHLIGRAYGVSPADVNAYVIGEHGDSQVALWSLATIGGVPLSVFQAAEKSNLSMADLQELMGELARDAAHYVIGFKGSTYYGISIATLKILRAIFRDENTILSVSTLVNGQYGLPEVALSLPCIVNARGRERILTPALAEEEEAGLHRSAAAIGNVLAAHATVPG